MYAERDIVISFLSVSLSFKILCRDLTLVLHDKSLSAFLSLKGWNLTLPSSC